MFNRERVVERIHILIKRMNLPSWRKSSDSTDNLRWLYKNLEVKNSNHPNYEEAMQLLHEIVGR